jgi:hypothetical protein
MASVKSIDRPTRPAKKGSIPKDAAHQNWDRMASQLSMAKAWLHGE